ncbi:Gastrula zinc finger protein like [Actinidia chinensis var. chinensis]|uniref:Gastrula zinc finger protein like n=1 Tax=Actinidia chinensis var. chinensis TaxID=1590841 RepID=A0A2R6QNM2_ACTCC|nr:Gastrula zinc finger protein like [Actinidia chinensis var. chinensis]
MDLFDPLYVQDCAAAIFSSPMPLIGTYVAAASLACSLAMAADVYHGFRNKKRWFPCKFFTLNAATLMLLGVAMKLSLDLSGSMPSFWDQLAKLSSNAFMCTAIGNSMPSIGPMDNKEIVMNVAALVILAITVVVNVCIQLRTTVIYNFLIQHAIVMFFMLFLLLILSFTALTVPITKKYLDKIVSDEEPEDVGRLTIEKLKEDLRKYQMMAETGNPQFVIARSVTSAASGGICFSTALILALTWLGYFKTWPNRLWGFEFVKWEPQGFESNYKWSSIMITCSGSEGGSKSHEDMFKVEDYWIEKLAHWKERPLAFQFGSKNCRKCIHLTKRRLLEFCIRIQIVIVVVSKSVHLFTVFLARKFLSCCRYCEGCKKKSKANDPEDERGSKLDLRRYVLHLEGEEELPLQMMKNNSDATDSLIQMGKKKQPKYFTELLKNFTGINGIAAFDSDHVPALFSEEPPNCWALPVVTLTTIAIALPNIENHMVHQLLSGVREGLNYVALVEKNLDKGRNLVSIRNAAGILWLEVDIFCRWLDEDLQKISLEGKSSKENLERLSDMAKNIVSEFKTNTNGNLKEKPIDWPMKVIAANSMYRITKTILLELESSSDQTDEDLFAQLSAMITDILGACLTNLPRVISMKCFCSAIEKREESVNRAAHLLGETEEILEMLQQHELSGLSPDQAAYLHEWRALIKQKNPSKFVSTPNNDTPSKGSAELSITIE